MAENGDCRLEEIRAGQIRRMTSGLGSAWIQCPLTAAIKAPKVGKVRIGWTVARMERLLPRPVQCYRCWKFGHLRNNCQAGVDKRDRCFRCGEAGHLVRICTKRPKCIVCEEEGRDSEHRIGSAKYLIERYPVRNRNRGSLGMNERGRNMNVEKERKEEGKEEERRRREVIDIHYTPDRSCRAMELQDED